MMLSECCSAPPWHEESTGICGRCHMHAGFYDDEEQHNPLSKRTKDDVFSPQQQAIIDALMEEADEEENNPPKDGYMRNLIKRIKGVLWSGPKPGRSK